MKRFRILLFNMGYGAGVDGSIQDYIRYGYRFLYTPKEVQKKVLGKIKKIISANKPNLCCLIEIDKGSLTTGYQNQLKMIEDKAFPHSDIENKYSKKGTLSMLPFFSGKSNCFLSREKLRYKKHYFKHGTKKLIYELYLPKGITLFFTHFSLLKKTRKKQFVEMKALIKNKKKVIVCGDFNIFDGYEELNHFVENTNLKIIKTSKTFPSYSPKYTLDLFICSKTIKNIKCRVLKHAKMSDHLPILAELNI